MLAMLDHLDAFAVFTGAGVDFDLVALVNKEGDRDLVAGGDFGGLEHFAGGVALDRGLDRKSTRLNSSH